MSTSKSPASHHSLPQSPDGNRKLTFVNRSGSIDNPYPHLIPEANNPAPLEAIGSNATCKLVLVMVGLPGSGKSYISKRICRFLSFFHNIPCRIFNVGDYRRKLCGVKLPASFYDFKNPETLAQRNRACDVALEDLIEYMRPEGVRVAVLDATNSTRERRGRILEVLDGSGVGVKKVFIEVVSNDEKFLENSIRDKAFSPDYEGVALEEASRDFKERRRQYMEAFEELGDDEGCYIKILDCSKFIVHKVHGYLRLKVVHFLMNIHTMSSTFYLTRHGESEYNALGKIGGDSNLSSAGIEYARRLAMFLRDVIAVKTELDPHGNEIKVKQTVKLWTSTLRRTKQTAEIVAETSHDYLWNEGDKEEYYHFHPVALRNLDEIYAGCCDGMTYKEIEEKYPEEFLRRECDKLVYRYPRGESYMDLTLRLEPMALEMEGSLSPILIIGHQGILRILYAYFKGLKMDEAPYIDIPLNTIIELTPYAYGCHEKRYEIPLRHESFHECNT